MGGTGGSRRASSIMPCTMPRMPAAPLLLEAPSALAAMAACICAE